MGMFHTPTNTRAQRYGRCNWTSAPLRYLTDLSNSANIGHEDRLSPLVAPYTASLSYEFRLDVRHNVSGSDCSQEDKNAHMQRRWDGVT